MTVKMKETFIDKMLINVADQRVCIPLINIIPEKKALLLRMNIILGHGQCFPLTLAQCLSFTVVPYHNIVDDKSVTSVISHQTILISPKNDHCSTSVNRLM